MMGSSSNSSSNTYYANTPTTQENVSNPFNLSNSNWNKFGTTEIAGSTFNVSNDAATVGQAFDFGTKLVQVVADITRQNNASQAAAANDETKAAATGDTKTATAIDWKKYEWQLIAAGSVIAWWLIWGRKK